MRRSSSPGSIPAAGGVAPGPRAVVAAAAPAPHADRERPGGDNHDQPGNDPGGEVEAARAGGRQHLGAVLGDECVLDLLLVEALGDPLADEVALALGLRGRRRCRAGCRRSGTSPRPRCRAASRRCCAASAAGAEQRRQRAGDRAPRATAGVGGGAHAAPPPRVSVGGAACCSISGVTLASRKASSTGRAGSAPGGPRGRSGTTRAARRSRRSP